MESLLGNPWGICVNQAARGVLTFLTYALDAANAQLRRGDTVIPLRPKTLAVLQFMAEHSGRLVTKAEILDAVWPDTAVTESTLTSSIKELRRVLDDDPKSPRVIETAHGHGYRFIAEVGVGTPVSGVGSQVSGSGFSPAPSTRHPKPSSPTPSLVGRNADLAQLDTWLARVFARERQVGFIAGDAGMGKTALVDVFCAQLRAAGVLVAHGQCLEHHGASEPYLPVLEGFERLCATAEGAPLLALLRRHAPTWLAQLGGLLAPEELETLQRHLAGTTRERMLREMASLVVALPAPLVLVLEDLHWSDNATIDLVAALAQRRDPAPLLVIGTYRPVDVVIDDHPFRNVHQQLRAHGRSRELWLQPLDERAVTDYVSARWAGLAASKTLARAIHGRTDGNPLFVVSVADYLAAEGVVADTGGQCVLTKDISAVRLGVPQGLRPMINTQIDRLVEADRELLEASSVVGRTFSAALVARALDTGVVDVEARLERLARRGQLVRNAGEATWPDGTVAGRYELIHSLHQHELIERVPPARRRQLHERIATRLQDGYASRTAEIASELAYHFEAAGQAERAVPYLEEAATRAIRRGGSAEAGALFERALAVLNELPPNPERILRTIRVSMSYAIAMQVRLGPTPELEAVCERARALSEETDDLPQLFQALGILFTFCIIQARFHEARRISDQVTALAQRLVFPGFVSLAHTLRGMVDFHTGDLTRAQQHLALGLNLDDVQQPVNPLTINTQKYNYEALTLLHLGYPDQARAHNRAGAAQAATAGTPFDRGQTAMIACYLHMFVRDTDALIRSADEAASIAEDYGYAMVQAVSLLGRGRVRVARGEHTAGIAMMQEALDLYRSRRQGIGLPTILSNFADAHCEAGNIDAGFLLLAEARALIDSTGEVRFKAELQRLEGELRERSRDYAVAERCYRNAVDIAHDQGARWWELRASVSLARLRRQQHKRADVRPLLEPIVSAFTEGFDTSDVRAAQALLAQL